ncbi:allantoin permease [Gordonia spumicola]|uniref:Allantoin permease n=1 Tax=Gordonia spumicola TaxID=589161 RepID=A0A7I9V4P2_9ACTN|nr:cytosine permease [Gordonia spumicola]GEE00152.1 allantoin permease [Gordonia spumicola]
MSTITEADKLAPDVDGVGRIEAHGIDFIPESERRGKARDLFAVWAAPNVSYLALVVGGALVLMGLQLWQAIAVIVVGNLVSIPVGVIAASGAASGTPSEVIMRAMFGVHGNRVNIAITGWLISVCYLAMNWAAAAATGFALADRFGIPVNTVTKIVIIVAIAAVTLVLAVYGHATIVRVYVPLTLALITVFAMLAYFVIGHAVWSYDPPPLTGVELFGTLTAGTALVASGPLSYSNSADFARYLPSNTSVASITWWTTIGMFVPSVLFTSIGSIAATAVDMTDPQTGLEGVLPDWFVPVFLVAVIVGTVANNAMTAYSSGLALQAVGLRLRRSVSVLLDGTVGIALTLYALLVSNFIDTISNLMQFIVVVTGPVIAIYTTDLVLRRNRYDGLQVSDETSASPFWYVGGVNPAGFVALIVSSAAAILCVSAPDFTGPVASAMSDVDLSLPVGMVLASVIYGTMMASTIRRQIGVAA